LKGNTLKWDTKVDEKGRIIIPHEIRNELMLKPKQKLTIRVLNNRELILRSEDNSEEFISEMKGCVSSSRIEPKELKQIWGLGHSHN